MKTQIRVQKILMLVSLVVAALTFVFALFFLTGGLGYAIKYTESNSVGAEKFVEMSQNFVDTLVILAIVFILLAAALFITSSHSRRNYYITNYIAVGLFVVYALFVAIFIIVNVANAMQLYAQIDWVSVPEKAANLGGLYPMNQNENYQAIIGYVVAAIVIIDAALLVLSTVWKYMLMKGEKQLLGRTANTQAEEVAQ